MYDLMSGSDGKRSLVYERMTPVTGRFGHGGFGGPSYAQAIQYGGYVARHSSMAAGLANLQNYIDPLLTAGIEILVTLVLGTGLKYTPKLNAENLSLSHDQAQELSRRFKDKIEAYFQNPIEVDLYARSNVYDMIEASLKSLLINGEALIAYPFRKRHGAKHLSCVQGLAIEQLDNLVTRTELLNGRRVNILRGVAVDDISQQICGYWIREAPLANPVSNPIGRFEARFNREGRLRIGHYMLGLQEHRQIRGINPGVASALQPSLSNRTLAELLSAKAMVATAFAATIESSQDSRTAFGQLSVNDALGNTGDGLNEWASKRGEFYGAAGDKMEALVKPEAGTLLHLFPQDKLVLHRDISGEAGYSAILRDYALKTASALGLSFETLTGDFSQSSYTAARFSQAVPYQRSLRIRRQVSQIMRDIVQNFLEECFARGEFDDYLPANARPFMEARSEYAACEFLGPPKIEPDDYRANQADLLKLENNMMSYHEYYANRGQDFETEVRRISKERELLRELGLGIPGNVSTQVRENEDIDPNGLPIDQGATPKRETTNRLRSDTAHLALPMATRDPIEHRLTIELETAAPQASKAKSRRVNPKVRFDENTIMTETNRRGRKIGLSAINRATDQREPVAIDPITKRVEPIILEDEDV